jgi:hypothetical protein
MSKQFGLNDIFLIVSYMPFNFSKSSDVVHNQNDATIKLKRKNKG